MSNNWDLFEVLFSDSVVIDLDFSEWDRVIKIVVVSDHMESVKNRLQVFSVNFYGVKLFSLEYLEEINVPEVDGEYCQWNIHDFRINKVKDLIEIKLIPLMLAPVINIKCKEFNIDNIEHKVLDKILLNWDKPSSPFIRRSIVEMYKQKLG